MEKQMERGERESGGGAGGGAVQRDRERWTGEGGGEKKMRFGFLICPLFLANNYILILRTFISSILNP
jgi:hypothetical protein